MLHVLVSAQATIQSNRSSYKSRNNASVASNGSRRETPSPHTLRSKLGIEFLQVGLLGYFLVFFSILLKKCQFYGFICNYFVSG